MTETRNTLIGDIIEINRDIIAKRISSTYPKFITNLMDKYYRYRLVKLVKSLKKKELILMKANVQELFIYIMTYYNGKYKNISNVSTINTNVDNMLSANVYIEFKEDPVYNKLNALFTVKSNSDMDIKYTLVDNRGVVITSKVEVNDLYYKKDHIELPKERVLKELNDSLLDTLESFLLEYLERYKNQGYIKEVKE